MAINREKMLKYLETTFQDAIDKIKSTIEEINVELAKEDNDEESKAFLNKMLAEQRMALLILHNNLEDDD